MRTIGILSTDSLEKKYLIMFIENFKYANDKTVFVFTQLSGFNEGVGRKAVKIYYRRRIVVSK